MVHSIWRKKILLYSTPPVFVLLPRQLSRLARGRSPPIELVRVRQLPEQRTRSTFTKGSHNRRCGLPFTVLADFMLYQYSMNMSSQNIRILTLDARTQLGLIRSVLSLLFQASLHPIPIPEKFKQLIGRK